MVILFTTTFSPISGTFIRQSLPPHPRLILDANRLAALQDYLQNNTQAQTYYQGLLQQGEVILTLDPLPRPPEGSGDILAAARAVLQRLYVVSLLYRITKNDTWAERARIELLNCTQWQDWDIINHALDTGELCHATGIALDWTYDYLSTQHADSLQIIINGMVDKGMIPFRQAYNHSVPGWWSLNPSNWATVTNGGAGIAALALLGEENVPQWIENEILPGAIAGVNSSVSCPYKTDGEGYNLTDHGGKVVFIMVMLHVILFPL